ncbi:unnamed protein product [Orchesella dallaii]
MEENIYLVRWLRARQFDIDGAEKMLLKDLKWRADNNLDTIDDEDWKVFELEYPVNQDGLDKQGRPLVQLNFGSEWNIRRASVTGRLSRLARWTYKYLENGTRRVRKLQSEGKNVTQFSVIIGMDGFNPVIHTCVRCMSYYFTLVDVFEEHYNGHIDKVHTLDLLEPARVLIRILLPLLSVNTREALVFWGTRQKEWKAGLSKDIDENQLLQSYGGTLDADNTTFTI